MPEQAGVVRSSCYLMADDGMTPVAIARVLTSRGVPSPPGVRALADGRPLVGDLWTARHVRTILRRPLYIGFNVMGRRRMRNGIYRSPPVIGEVPHLRIVGREEAPFIVVAILRAL